MSSKLIHELLQVEQQSGYTLNCRWSYWTCTAERLYCGDSRIMRKMSSQCHGPDCLCPWEGAQGKKSAQGASPPGVPMQESAALWLESVSASALSSKRLSWWVGKWGPWSSPHSLHWEKSWLGMERNKHCISSGWAAISVCAPQASQKEQMLNQSEFLLAIPLQCACLYTTCYRAVP